MISIRIIKSDITEVKADAIVNAANEHLARGGGVCGAIFEAAGISELEAACKKIGYCDTGSAVITPAFDMDAKFIIHAVGPRWTGGDHGEAELLRAAYQKALSLAKFYHCDSIVFPLISAGIFHYPEEAAWREAMEACKTFEKMYPEVPLEIIFAVRSDEKLELGERSLARYALRLSAKAKSIHRSLLIVGDAHKEAVFFHRPEEPSGFLCNWFPSSFRIGNLEFSSAEQFLMFKKCILFGDRASAKAVMNTNNPREQQKIGRNVSGYIPKVWDGARQTIVLQGLLAKFTQNKELKQLLLDTGDAWLVECAGSDEIWACGIRLYDDRRTYADQWTGRNILGFALMEARRQIRSQE